jgi:D-alanine transaminase
MTAPFPLCYLNGNYEPLAGARISPLDRGFLFADSVYEVLPVFAGRPFRFREHFARLDRSLHEIGMVPTHSHTQWLAILNELVRRNNALDAYLYVQVTRGMELGRNHAFPADAKPTVFAIACPLPAMTPEQHEHGFAAITVEDNRWDRCDIKSTALLANVLAKQQAAVSGASEAILLRNGVVTEGASTSVFAVVDKVIVTPPNGPHILPGTTRDVVLELASGKMPTAIRPLHHTELRRAEEVWIAAATRDVLPITRIDGQPIGDGKPGPLWRQMCELFVELRRQLAHSPAL